MADADQIDGIGILGWRARAIDAEVALAGLNRQLDAAVQLAAALRGERDNLAAITENNNAWIARLHNEAIELEADRDAHRAMVCDLLASAYPHPVEHPTMTKQWDRARSLLKNGKADP